MDFFMKNILTLVCFFPLLGVFLIILWPKGKENETAVKWIANIVTLLGFLISITLITEFNRPEGVRWLKRDVADPNELASGEMELYARAFPTMGFALKAFPSFFPPSMKYLSRTRFAMS